MTDTTARPPGFHLKVRLVDAGRVAFSNNEYRLQWGPGAPLRGQTTAEGCIERVVDGNPTIEGGTLELGKLVSGKFTPKIVIPLCRHVGEATRSQSSSSPSAPGSPSCPPVRSYDIAWRLVNLMFLGQIPSTPSIAGLPMAPAIPDETKDAVLRFKAANHTALGISDWLDSQIYGTPGAFVPPGSLTRDQDDAFVKLLLVQHDNISDGDAATKLSLAQSSTSSAFAGNPL